MHGHDDLATAHLEKSSQAGEVLSWTVWGQGVRQNWGDAAFLEFFATPPRYCCEVRLVLGVPFDCETVSFGGHAGFVRHYM